MDSSDEIVVAAPRRHSSGFSTGSIATASDSVAGGWKADLDTVSATNTSTEAVAAAAARVVDLTGSSSRASSPLSDVDEDVLQEAPTAILRQLASDEGLLSSPSSASKSSLDPLSFNSSAPQPSSSDRSTRKRARATDTMSASDEPPAKRRRGRPAQSAAPQTFAPPNRTSGGIVDELGLDDVNDDLDVRPTRGRVLSNGGGSIANRLGRRSTARSMLDGDADGMGKPRRRAADRLAVNEKYEPLHLYEESSMSLPPKAYRHRRLTAQQTGSSSTLSRTSHPPCPAHRSSSDASRTTSPATSRSSNTTSSATAFVLKGPRKRSGASR